MLKIQFIFPKTAMLKIHFIFPKNVVACVPLLNIYAKVGRWDEVDGLSSKIVCIHLFLGIGHTFKQQKNALFESLYRQMKGAGYMPDMNFVAHDMD